MPIPLSTTATLKILHGEYFTCVTTTAGCLLVCFPQIILSLTSLDFLGLGVPPGTPSLGELLAQGKNNIDAWWISLSTFAVLVVTLMLLTFMGDALRDALDPRKART